LLSIGDLGRVREIATVLASYGFEDLVARLNLPGVVVRRRRARQRGANTAERIRMALEELGPTFVKLGQLLSTRPDILPPDIIEELERLQDQVPPVPYEAIAEQIRASLGDDPESIFEEFSREPLASASVAQVHLARLDGVQVVVKVQRPGIRRKIQADIRIMEALARAAEARIRGARLYDPVGLVEEFATVISRELDFEREARNLITFRENFRGWDQVKFPRVYLQYSSREVVTQELIEGTAVNEWRASAEEKRRLALTIVDAFIKQVFEDGLFHADPHPGNLLVVRGNRLGIIDVGMVGWVTEAMKRDLGEMFLAIVTRNYPRLTRVVLRVARDAEEVNEDRLSRDLMEVVEQHYRRSLGQINLGELLRQLFLLVNRHRIRLGPDYALLLKAVIAIEGVGRTLCPSLNLIEELRPHAERLARERWGPGRLRKELLGALLEAEDLLRDTPRWIRTILRRTARGHLTIEFRHVGLEPLISSLHEVSRRLVAGLVIAALVVSSSLLATADAGPRLFGYPALTVVGYLSAMLIALWVFFFGPRKR